MPGIIRRLTLSNFRNYRSASVEPGDAATIVLVGPNGAGKTNLIEAISFLAPGRGLRRAALDEVAFREGDGSWAVAAEVEGALGLATLGTGIERRVDEGEHETAELAVAVASLRAETVSRLATVLASRRGSAFPPAEIALDGWMEKLIPAHPAVE